jgi:hypothetical protein
MSLAILLSDTASVRLRSAELEQRVVSTMHGELVGRDHNGWPVRLAISAAAGRDAEMLK